LSRPKPASARQGNANSTPTIDTANAVAVAVPDPPGALGEVGSEVWVRVWTAGAKAYQPATDSLIIERYCSLQERRSTLLGVITVEGWLATGSTGQVVVHPAAKLLSEVEGRLGPIEDRLGLNPEARLRLGIAAVEHQSRLDRFLDEEALTS